MLIRMWAGGAHKGGNSTMAKYLYEAKYSAEAVRALQKADAASRVKAIQDMCATLGGSLESFHFAFGGVDAYVIVDLPDDVSAASAAFAVAASGTTSVKTVKLLTVDETDAALSGSAGYRPPGS